VPDIPVWLPVGGELIMADHAYYDDPAWVQGYIQSRHSGLSRNELVEEPAVRALLAPVALHGRACLDLGCGSGLYSALLAERGGIVTAIDRSALMLDAARTLSAHEHIQYHQMGMEEAAFPDASFDMVISNMALHYLADMPAMVNKIAAWTRPGGTFILTVEHPIFTATRETPLATWHDGDAATRDKPLDTGHDGAPHTEWIITNYFATGARQGPFGLHYHHTFQDYLDAFVTAGFLLQAISEPRPSAEALHKNPHLVQDLHRPVFLGFRCQKAL
jgi:SAM-dependent methyltransferase